MTTATTEDSKELTRGNQKLDWRLIPLAKDVIASPLPFGPDEPVNAGHESEGLSATTATNVSVTLD